MPIFDVACWRSSIVSTFLRGSLFLLPVVRVSLFCLFRAHCHASSKMSETNWNKILHRLVNFYFFTFWAARAAIRAMRGSASVSKPERFSKSCVTASGKTGEKSATSAKSCSTGAVLFIGISKKHIEALVKFFDKNWNFWQKVGFFAKTDMFVKKWYFWQKTKILDKKWNFWQKVKF